MTKQTVAREWLQFVWATVGVFVVYVGYGLRTGSGTNAWGDAALVALAFCVPVYALIGCVRLTIWAARTTEAAEAEDAAQRAETLEHIRVLASNKAGQNLEELRRIPYFKEYEGDIRQALIDHEEWGANLHQAFYHVLTTKILPTLNVAEAKTVTDSLRQQGTPTSVALDGITPAL